MEGRELKEKREKLELTQTELADILGVKMNTVYRWESGILSVPQSIELAMETVERRYENKDAKNISSKWKNELIKMLDNSLYANF